MTSSMGGKLTLSFPGVGSFSLDWVPPDDKVAAVLLLEESTIRCNVSRLVEIS